MSLVQVRSLHLPTVHLMLKELAISLNKLFLGPKTLKICRLAANRGGNPQGFGQTPRTPRRKLQGWLLLLLQGLSYKNRRQHRYQHHFRSDGSATRSCQDC
jgi:hypothetical protein